MAIEFTGAITPPDYSGTVSLRRSIVSGGYYLGSSADASQCCGNPPTPGDDTSFSQLLATATQAGQVFDIDAPGIGAPAQVSGPVDSLKFFRQNFVEYAVLVLLDHKRTLSCRIVLWDHASPRQAHKRNASRHI